MNTKSTLYTMYNKVQKIGQLCQKLFVEMPGPIIEIDGCVQWEHTQTFEHDAILRCICVMYTRPDAYRQISKLLILDQMTDGMRLYAHVHDRAYIINCVLNIHGIYKVTNMPNGRVSRENDRDVYMAHAGYIHFNDCLTSDDLITRMKNSHFVEHE